MANRKIFPTKDASMYTDNPRLNSGLDEILEASTNIGVTTFKPKTWLNPDRYWHQKLLSLHIEANIL